MRTTHEPRRFHALRSLMLLGLFVSGFLFSGVVMADPPGPPAPQCNMQAFNEALGARESGGDYTAVNSYGYMGKYQFGTQALQDTGYMNSSGQWTGKNGINSQADWLNSPSVQEDAMNQFTQIRLGYIRSAGLTQYVGQTINGVNITMSGLLAGCHLKGCGGVSACLRGTGSCTDGYGTNVFEYMQKFGGYDVGDGANGCTPYSNNSSPRSQTFANPMCSEAIRANTSMQVQAAVQMRNDFITTNVPPPASVQQVANTPCMSNELQRIANQFAYAPSMYAANGLTQINALLGPISGIVNNLFGASFQSFMSASSLNPGMLNFQGMAQNALGSLMSRLGVGGPFASQLCGMMVDMLLKYIQCQNPITLPSLGQIMGGLNNMLGSGCAGQALTSTLYSASNMSALQTFNQPVQITPGGTFSMGPVPQPPAPTR